LVVDRDIHQFVMMMKYILLALAFGQLDLDDLAQNLDEPILMDVDQHGDANYHFGATGMSPLWELQMLVGATSDSWYKEGDSPLEVDASESSTKKGGEVEHYIIKDGPLYTNPQDRTAVLAAGLENLEHTLQERIDELERVVDPRKAALPFGTAHESKDDFYYTVFNTPAPQNNAFVYVPNTGNMRTHSPDEPSSLRKFLQRFVASNAAMFASAPAAVENGTHDRNVSQVDGVQGRNLREHNDEHRPSLLVKMWASLEDMMASKRDPPPAGRNLRTAFD
jgi:hypothetical protein